MKKAIVLAALIVLAFSATSFAAASLTGSVSTSFTLRQDAGMGQVGNWQPIQSLPSLTLNLNASQDKVYDFVGALALSANTDTTAAWYFYNAKLNLYGDYFTYTFLGSTDGTVLDSVATPVGFLATTDASASEVLQLRMTSQDAFKNLTNLNLTQNLETAGDGTQAATTFVSTTFGPATVGGAAKVPFYADKAVGSDTAVDGYVTVAAGPATITGEAKTVLNQTTSVQPSYGVKASLNVPGIEGLSLNGNYESTAGVQTAGAGASLTLKGDPDDSTDVTAVKTWAVTASGSYSSAALAGTSSNKNPGISASVAAAAAVPGVPGVAVYGSAAYTADQDGQGGAPDLDVTEPVTGNDVWFATNYSALTTLTGKVYAKLNDKWSATGTITSYTGKALDKDYKVPANPDFSALTVVGSLKYALSSSASLTWSLGQGTFSGTGLYSDANAKANTGLIAKMAASVSF
ncbi:MAG: hypothetical protein IMW99_09570 [Firmicutes bacterium]|nr:hypothetical protein [Bacillota bacterium]